MDKKLIIREIVEGIINFKILPFFGAGMSKPCQALGWAEIICILKQEIDSDTENYLLVAQEYENKFGRIALIEKLKMFCELKDLSSKSLDNHMKILAMNPPIIYTTNYDNALEEASKMLLRDYKKIVGLRDVVESVHGEKQIIKFHGDFSDMESIVFTRSDYDKRFNAQENPLDILFRSHILGKSVLFLGYGFGDENIDYIFKKHNELYGPENLLKSYIISFEHNSEREAELQKKNVITLVLESVQELNKLISDINSEVFSKSYHSQFENFFKTLPSIILTSFELDNLKTYVASESFTPMQKHDKIRETIEGKSIPQDIESDLYMFFEKIIKEDYHEDIKEAILITFQHTHFRVISNIVKLCIELLRLTENSKFIIDLDSVNWGSDVIMIIEHKLGDTFKNGVETRKWSCLIILAYLDGMIAENKKLPFKQVDRLLNGLKNFGYDEFDDIGAGFTSDNVNHIIEHYLTQHGSTLRSRFKSQSIFGKRRHTAVEIMEEMMKSLPKDLENF